MGLLNPSTYNDAKTIEYYSQLVASVGIQSQLKGITPFFANGDFNVSLAAAGSTSKFFDIGNIAKGNLDSAADMPGYTGRNMLVGNLWLTTYAVGIAGGALMTFQQFLATGLPSATTSWQIRKRTAIPTDDTPNINSYDGTAAPPIVKAGFSDQYLGVGFSFLQLNVSQTGAGTVGVTCEFLFNGIKIDY